MKKKTLSVFVILLLLCSTFLKVNVLAADFSSGVDASGSTATIWFKSTVNTTWVDSHYKINSGDQQNIRMSYNSSKARYEQNIAVKTGDTIDYSFTYNNGTPAYDTAWYNFKVGASNTTPSVDGVTFYENINYGGASYKLPIGNYTLAQLNAAGIPNDWMSSIKVPAGWTVEAYENDNFSGNKWIFTLDSSWIGTDANDKMTSVKIYKTGTTTPTVPTTGKVMFDDFSYTGSNDSNISAHGWTLRNQTQTSPGPEGCSFLKNNISFLADPQDSSNKLMRLTATTNGTGAGTSQAEVYTTNRKYSKGTYAARVRFTDTPTSGTDGAGINETFFTISPLEGYRDPNYSELDFEYLANGGWGSGQGMWTTSWHTYTADPWYKDGSSKFKAGSFAGWHTLIINVADDGNTTYYIDGAQYTKDTPYYGPRKLMTINFNLWFITGEGENPLNPGTYVQDVDWVYHAKDSMLSPDQVNSVVQSMRANKTTFVDNVN